MKLTEIKKIEEILTLDQPLLKHKILGLAVPSENGNSFLLNVDLRLKNEKNFEEKLEVIAKLAVGSSNGVNRAQPFQNEIAFYRSILPILREFIKLQGAPALDLFPLYYGGRLTLNSRTKDVDQDGIFFLENLKKSGFENIQPQAGFDLETTKIILKQLSRFHATFFAIKTKKPEVFKHKIKPHINKTENFVDENDMKGVVSLMWGHKECVSLIPRVRKAMAQKKLQPREPFSTIIHNNLWTKNIMVKSDFNARKSIKIVDFQHFDYGSPAHDIIFFLFTSAEKSVLEDHLEELFKYYHSCLVAELQHFEIEGPSYSFEKFLEDITEASKSSFPRIMLKLKKTFSENHTKEYEEKAWYAVLEFAKRNWI